MGRWQSTLPCHCEKQSDVAIHTNPVIARSKATWQSIFQTVHDSRWIASPSARNDSNLCHCEERSDEAIHFSGGARLKMDCFAFGLQLQWGGLQLQWEWFVMTAPDLSLRGAKRRGNLFFRWCKTKAGLLRLRLAMTVRIH